MKEIKEKYRELCNDNFFKNLIEYGNPTDKTLIEFNQHFKRNIIDLKIYYYNLFFKENFFSNLIKPFYHSIPTVLQERLGKMEKDIENFYVYQHLLKIGSYREMVVSNISEELGIKKLEDLKGKNTSVFLIEFFSFLFDKQRRIYLGKGFTRGDGLSDKEIEKLQRFYGFSRSSFVSDCSQYRSKPIEKYIDEMIDIKIWQNALLFLNTKYNNDDHMIPEKIFQQIMKIYLNKFCS